MGARIGRHWSVRSNVRLAGAAVRGPARLLLLASLTTLHILSQEVTQPVPPGQKPAPSTPGPTTPGPTTTPAGEDPAIDNRSRAERNLPVQPKLTPYEERERQIRALDPMNRNDPRDPMGLRTDPRQQTDTADPKQGLATPLLRISPQKPEADKGEPSRTGTGTGTTDRFGQFQRAVATEPAEGPQVISADGAGNAAQEYTGPAVLSRNYTLSRNVGTQAVKWSWTVGISEVFDSGVIGNIAPASTTAQGVAAVQTATSTAAPVANGSSSTTGRQLTWGFSARHAWKRDFITANYGGGSTSYGSGSNYNGTNHSLAVQYSRILSRRIRFSANSGAQILSRSASLENGLAHSQVSIADINFAVTPATQVTDQGSKNLNMQANLAWQRSSKMSLSIGMGYVGMSRAGGGVGGTGSLGSAGVTEQFDLNYRRSSKNTIGVFYSHGTFTYSHRLNLSNTNSIGGMYSLSLSKATQLSARAGFAVLQNELLQQVRIDPIFAVLIGRAGGIVNTYRVSINPDISAQISHTFSRGRGAHLAYNQGVAGGGGGGGAAGGGNTAGTTATQRTMVGGYSMKLFRQYRFGVNVGSTSSSVLAGQPIAGGVEASTTTDSKFLGTSISRSFSHGVGTNFTVDYRTFSVPDNPNLRSQLRFTTGVTWGPGDGKLW